MFGVLERDISGEDERTMNAAMCRVDNDRRGLDHGLGDESEIRELEVYLVGRRARVGEPLALVEVVVGDLSEGHLQVLARGLDGHRPVVEQDLPGALEQPPRVARDAADSADLAGQRQGLAVAQGEFGGDAPGPGVGDGDGAPDGLVELMPPWSLPG
jgi:hypothetical protein